MCGGFDFSTSAHATLGMLIFAQMLQWFPQLPWACGGRSATVAFGVIAGRNKRLLCSGPEPHALHCHHRHVVRLGAAWRNGLQRGNTIPHPAARPFSKLSSATIGVTPIPWLFIFMLAVIIIYSVHPEMDPIRPGASSWWGGNPMASPPGRPQSVKSPRIFCMSITASWPGSADSSGRRSKKMYSPHRSDSGYARDDGSDGGQSSAASPFSAAPAAWAARFFRYPAYSGPFLLAPDHAAASLVHHPGQRFAAGHCANSGTASLRESVQRV